MNCYYSNLIEGHDTHPVDIERALKADYSTDPEQRNLQLEARALAACGRDGCDDATIRVLQELRDEATRVGLLTAVPLLNEALSQHASL